MAAKFDWKGYFEPTPKLFRKIGDSILGASAGISTTSLISALNTEDEKVKKLLIIVTIVSIVGGYFGKILTNFFKEDNDVQQ
jgi:hypothetical protein